MAKNSIILFGPKSHCETIMEIFLCEGRQLCGQNQHNIKEEWRSSVDQNIHIVQLKDFLIRTRKLIAVIDARLFFYTSDGKILIPSYKKVEYYSESHSFQYLKAKVRDNVRNSSWRNLELSNTLAQYPLSNENHGLILQAFNGFSY